MNPVALPAAEAGEGGEGMMAAKREQVVQSVPANGERAVAPRPTRLPASTAVRLRVTRARTLLWTLVAAALLARVALALWTALRG